MTDLSQPIPPLPAQDLAVVILAAGKGTRMKSAMSKVMHPIAGVPMIKHILTTAESLNPKKIIVVLAPAMDDVAKIAAPHSIAIQQQQLGTGDALKAAIHELGDFKGNILVLYGDVPLVSAHTLNGLVAHRMNGQFGATVLAMVPPNATGYGRIFQNADGTLAKIVEEKDASDEEKRVRLSNSGLMVLDGDRLADTLLKLQNTNHQGEYYLVDVPGLTYIAFVMTLVSQTLDTEIGFKNVLTLCWLAVHRLHLYLFLYYVLPYTSHHSYGET